MPRRAARMLVRSLRPVIDSHFERRGPQNIRADILVLDGSPGDRTFTLDPHGADYVLDESHVTLGQTVATYDMHIGLAVGDTLLLCEIDVADWVAFEVQSDTDVV